jgi:hypothetical protein
MSSPDPYRPPQATVVDQDRPRGAPVKGMALGLLVDIGGSLLANFALIFIWAIWLAASGDDAQAIEEAMKGQADPTSGISLIAYALGMMCSWLGGYVCARTARETELRCAGVVAGAGVAIAFIFGADLMTPLYFLMVVTGALVVMLGGWMGAQRNARQA